MKKVFTTVLSLFTICIFSGLAQEEVADIQKKSVILISVNTEDGVGYFTDANGNKLFGLEFQEVTGFVNGLAAVKKDGKWGGINSQGGIVIPCIYESVYVCPHGVVVVMENMCGLLNHCGKEIYPCVYDYLPIRGELFAKVNVNGKFGIMNSEFELVIPCIYDEFCDSNSDVFELNDEGIVVGLRSNIIVARNGKYGMINRKGEGLIDFLYDKLYLTYDSANYVVAEKDGLCGCLNLNGEEVVPLMYDDIYEYEHANYVAEKMFVVTKDGKKGLMTKEGELILPCIYSYVYPVTENLFVVNKDEKDGLMTKEGELIPPCIYSNVYPVTENLFIVTKDEKDGLVDRNGTVILSCKYDEISTWCEDGKHLMVKNDEMYGSINYLGEQVVPCMYTLLDCSYADEFTEWVGSSHVLGRELPGGNYECVNFAGKKVPKDVQSGFILGYARAKQNHKYGLINTYGEIVVPCIYDELLFDICIYRMDNALVVKKGRKYGIVSFSGEELIPCEYDAWEEFYAGGILKKDDEYCIVSYNGTLQYPYMFQDIMNYDIDATRTRNNTTGYVVKMAGKWYLLYGDEEPILIPDGVIVHSVEDADFVSYSFSGKEMLLNDILECNCGFILMSSNDGYMLVNKFGKVIIPSCGRSTYVSKIE